MARLRKERPAEMSGLLDFLNIFGPPEPEKEKPRQHALPAPGSGLPALRKEEGGLIQAPKKEGFFDKLLSIFDVFGPAEKPGLPAQIREEETLPAEIEEKAGGLVEETQAPWDVLFDPSPEEEPPIYEMFQPPSTEVSPIEPTGRRYHFVQPSDISKIHYGEIGWKLPSAEEMATHLSQKIDLQRVFSELEDIRWTEGYQDLLATTAYQGVPLYTPVSVVDDRNFYTDFADFYGIPWSVVEQYKSREEFEEEVLGPLGMTLTEAFEMLKPDDLLPGFFRVEYNPEKRHHYLFYVEPWIGKLPGA